MNKINQIPVSVDSEPDRIPEDKINASIDINDDNTFVITNYGKDYMNTNSGDTLWPSDNRGLYKNSTRTSCYHE